MTTDRKNLEDIIRRIKSATNLALYASDAERDAAIAGVVRIMEKNIATLANFGQPRVPLKPIVETRIKFVDNTTQIDKAIKEKFEALRRIDQLENEIEEHKQTIRDLRNRLLKHKPVNITEPSVTQPQHDMNQSPKPIPIITPARKRAAEYDVADLKMKLDAIFEKHGLWLKPSPAMAEVLKRPNLQDTIPHLPRELAVEFSLITLPQDIFKEILEVFVLKGAKGYRKFATIVVALVNNMPFTSDELSHRRLLVDASNSWTDVRKRKPVEPWAAFAIRCGIIQDNLHRLEDQGSLPLGRRTSATHDED